MTVNILNVLRMSENDKKIQPSRKKWQRTWISNSQTANKYILKHLFSVTRSMEIQIKKKKQWNATFYHYVGKAISKCLLSNVNKIWHFS